MPSGSVEAGYCHCGWGEKTRLKRGKAQRYVLGHSNRGRRFTSGPDYLVDERGCWVWQRARTRKGYGQKVLPGQIVIRAHRWYYEQAWGPIPEGLQLDHLCRNPPCVNPDHLEVVTNQENVHRGRSTKLTWEQVQEIRVAPRGYGTRRPLALKLGVSDSTISAVRNHQNWKEVS
jgi:hypothetical protein